MRAGVLGQRIMKFCDYGEIVGCKDGNVGIDAFKDAWCDAQLPNNTNFTSLSIFFRRDGFPDNDRVLHDLGTEVLHETEIKHIKLSDTDDKCAWDLSSSGAFSYSSAWNLVRQRSLHSSIYSNCWHPHFSPKISIFMWRLINQGLPTDHAISKNGITVLY